MSETAHAEPEIPGPALCHLSPDGKITILNMARTRAEGATWRARLKAARQAKGLTQKRLSELVGKKSASAVQSWESENGFQPSLEEWPLIAGVLGQSPCWLVFGEEGQTIPQHRTHNRDLLERCIAETMAALDRHKSLLPPDGAAKVFLAVYDLINERGEPPDLRAEVLRILARRDGKT